MTGIVDIEQKLNALWKSEESKNLVRACLFNLIIVIRNTERKAYFQEAIKGVIGKFPCRVIFITIDPSSEKEQLDVNVKAEMVGTKDLKIACELIEINVSGKVEEERVPYLVLPHILPDLPVYFFWTKDPNRTAPLLHFLKNYATKVIFDAEGSEDLGQFSKGVLKLVDSLSINVGDINWTALNGWRKIIAALFPDKSSLLQLMRTKSLKIHYNILPTQRLKHNEREAIYLQAWIAAQLGCIFESYESHEGNIRITYKRPLHTMTVHLIPEEQTLMPEGALIAVELESLQDDAQFILKRNPGTRQIYVHSSTHDHCDLPHCVYLPHRIPGQDLIDEIFYKKGSAHYLNMLKMLFHIAE